MDDRDPARVGQFDGTPRGVEQVRRTLRGSVLQAWIVRGRRRRRPARGQVDADELGRSRPPRLHRDGGAAAQEQAQAQHHRPPARRGSCAGRGACALADRPVPDRERRDGERSHSRPLAYAPYPAPRPPRAHAQRLPTLFQMAEVMFEPNAFVSIELSIEGAATPASLPRCAHSRPRGDSPPHIKAAAVDVCRGCAL